MSRVAVAEAKSRFSDLLRRAEYGGERIVVHRHGRPVAAIVSTADLEQLESLEEGQDIADARTALKEAARKGAVALEVVLKKHHLEHLLRRESGDRPRRSTPPSTAAPRRAAASKPARARLAHSAKRPTSARQR